MLGVPEVRGPGQKCYELFRCSRHLTENCSIRAADGNGGQEASEFEIECNDGRKIPCVVTVAPLLDVAGQRIAIIEGIRDITYQKKVQEKLRTLALVDELTGLYNRRGFLTLAEEQTKLVQRTRRGILFLFIDLDEMKGINDTLGHEKGDEALKDLAAALKLSLRECDIVGRVGGDEFAVTVVEAGSDSAEIIGGRIRDNLATRNLGNRGYSLSVSIGSVYYDGSPSVSLDELLARADELMYTEKRTKKGLGLE